MKTVPARRILFLIFAVALVLPPLGGCAGAKRSSSAEPTASPPPVTAVETEAPPVEAPDRKLPVDPAINVGRLPNGLTYFIRPNAEPKQRAEIRLAVNAGSLQEDDDQRGLAHMVEHMAFNGTRHFEKQQLVDYLETIGMRFGPDINAFTSFDETVYMLTLPTDDDAIVERGFLILEDWAHGVTFDGDEIDAERGVLIEEWRLGRGARARMFDEQFPILFQGSRYAERLPIGKIEILESAPYDALRRFYRDWYRPDLMAVIAVGDFDPERIEQLIHDHFAGLQGPEEPRPRESAPVPDHDETLWAIATDPEATSTSVSINYKLPKREEDSVGAYRSSLVESLYHSMLNARLNELRRKPDPPFLYAYSSSGGFVRTRDVYFQGAGVADDGLARGLDALLTEVERVDRHGFRASELERAKVQLLRGYEQAYRERDKRESAPLAAEIQRHFLTGEPMPGIEGEVELANELVPGIGLDELNHLAQEWISERNRVVTVSAPQKDGLPSPDRQALEAVFVAVQDREIEPWVDAVRDEPLLARKPQPGRIVERSSVDEIGVTEWRLSNGVRVILKPTDFQNDQILLGGFSPGGHSLVSDEQHTSASFASFIVSTGGVGEFDAIELEKKLAGKVASASAFISELEEGVSGSASPEDVETMFQLLYLQLTAPRRDEEAFLSLMERIEASLANRLARPETVFSDRLQETLSQEHPRRRPPTPEVLAEVDLDTALAVYRDRFADIGEFSFVLVGNFDPAQIEPLVLTYLGGLPGTGRQESWRDIGVRPPEGVVEVEVRKGLEPKSQVRVVFGGPAEWSRQNHQDIVSLASALRIRLREVLREDMGATYGVSVGGSISRRPWKRYSFSVSFGCAPQNVDEMLRAVFDEIERVKQEGFAQDYVDKVKEAQTRQRELSVRENGFWRGVLQNYYRFDLDPRLILAYDELVAGVTAEGLQAAARQYLDTERYVLGRLYPEEGATAAQD